MAMGSDNEYAYSVASRASACLAGVTTQGHCCWINGIVCPFLRDDGQDASRRWVCTLREKLGSWEAVHADPTYQETIGPAVFNLVGVYCGDWPRLGERCNECGVGG